MPAQRKARIISTMSADNRNNPLAFQRLKNAFQNLSGEKVTLSLKLGSEPENETWFEVILRPLSLKKTDLFENSLALKKIRKDTFLYWSFRDITNEHMMGPAMFSTDCPFIKTSSALLCLTKKSAELPPESNCIRCAKCINACPMGLMPAKLNKLALAKDYEGFAANNGLDCIECGSCSYV